VPDGEVVPDGEAVPPRPSAALAVSNRVGSACRWHVSSWAALVGPAPV